RDAQVLRDTVAAMGPAAVGGLAGILEEADVGGVRDIIGTLCSIATPEATEVVTAELRSADLARGRCIVEALRGEPGRASTAALVACLGHRCWELRQGAAFALGQRHDREAIASLGRLAGRWGPLKRHGAVRREAVRALGSFRESAAADELANVALGRTLWPLLRDTDVRTAAVRALARHMSPKAHEYLGLIAQRCKGRVAAEAARWVEDASRATQEADDTGAMAEPNLEHAGGEAAVASAERG
ncbi:MAG: HEAT repeat domain-containing protein, partial [Armatimonadota bacterium]